uniref:hypothetical protein n=1 Tax=Alistipes sp. TaxID=1872444 RepID=UPI0040565726
MKTNPILLILAFFLPLIGYGAYIYYGLMKEIEGADNYLWAALAGSILGLILAFA